MPEEINRVVTDSLADLHWTPSPDADENLQREGINCKRIARVGNIMLKLTYLYQDKKNPSSRGPPSELSLA